MEMMLPIAMVLRYVCKFFDIPFFKKRSSFPTLECEPNLVIHFQNKTEVAVCILEDLVLKGTVTSCLFPLLLLDHSLWGKLVAML